MSDKSTIRSRYYAALEQGHSQIDAVRIANGEQAQVKPVQAVAGDVEYPDDDSLRAEIKAATGKAPHWKASREKLIEQYEALSDATDR